MKIVKTANNVEIKLSRQEWELIGKQAGWLNTMAICPKCKAMLSSERGFAKGAIIKCPTCRTQFEASRHAPPPRKPKVEAPAEVPEQTGSLLNTRF